VWGVLSLHVSFEVSVITLNGLSQVCMAPMMIMIGSYCGMNW
jgi:hypothetical protein